MRNLFILLIIPSHVLALICSRYPANTFTPKSPVDENFVISISGNPQTYILGQEYNISLHAYHGHRFISFSLVLENDEGDTTYHEDLGHFEITDAVETRYSPNCVNMVDSTNTNQKTRIDVTWIAPSQPGSGCILIRATVLQHRDVWHMDDGGLTKRICEEVVDDVESKSMSGQLERPCCACDEARYELIFEGIWSRNLHPKDFPAKGWTTRFSDIVGAAHTGDYRFWEYGALATFGMKEFAEHGSARLLEKEFNLNFRNGKIRTIIKARGPAFPNLNGLSVANVRVDPQHHLVSLASKIEPSPDWIVGVSGLELCHTNCTWLEQKVINLYPWDVGTDAGPSYTSPNQPQVPPDVIRRMRSDFPNDPRSPFFDETGAPMKPLASLTIKRQRLYERTCEDPESNNVNVPRECYTHPWSAWTQCTAKCGEGKQYRSRVYKQPEVARISNCDRLVVKRQDRECRGQMCGENGGFANVERGGFGNVERGGFVNADNNNYLEPQAEYIDGVGSLPGGYVGGRLRSNAECDMTPWSAWSACNATCGEGKMMRRREYTNRYAEEKCQNARFMPLLEYQPCVGHNCLGDISQRNQFNAALDSNEQAYSNNEFNVNAEQDVFSKQQGNSWNNGNTRSFQSPIGLEDVERPANNFGFNELQAENLNQVVEQQPEQRRRGGYKKAHQQQQQARRRQQYQQSTEEQYAQPEQNYRLPPEHYRQPAEQLYEYQAELNDLRQSQFAAESQSQGVQVLSYCFEQLKIFNCLNNTVVGNFWFYNFCEDSCMLYAADPCDRNQNKFSSLEMCEMRCKQPGYAEHRLRKQQMECPGRRAAGEQKRSRWRG